MYNRASWEAEWREVMNYKFWFSNSRDGDGNEQRLEFGSLRMLAINNCKGKSMQVEFAGLIQTGGPALRRLSNHPNRAVNFAGKF